MFLSACMGEHEMITMAFYGNSDNLVYAGELEVEDEYTVSSVRAKVFTLGDVLQVTVKYNKGLWETNAIMAEEGMDIPFPMRLSQESTFSMRLEVDVPDDTVLIDLDED